MNKIKSLFKKFTKPTLINIAVLFAVIGVIIFTSWVLYNRTVNILTQNLRDRLITISITQAANIDAKDLGVLQVEDDWKKPEWTRVVNSLFKAKHSNKNIVYMYIFRKTKDDPTQMEFVADAESINPYANTENDPSGTTIPASSCTKCVDANGDGKIEPNGPDYLQWPGQPDPDPADHIPEAFQAYNGPITVKNLYTDAYGTVLTGYAPIKDDQGNVVAIVGTDIKADDFFTTTRQTLQPFLIFIASLSLIISILILVIFYSWKKNTKFLQEINEKLKAFDILKSKFLSLASHQLRNPISSIVACTSMFLEGSFGKIDDLQKKMLGQMLHGAQDMNDSIEKYLTIAKIDQGGLKYNLEKLDLADLSNGVTEQQKLSAEKRNLTLSFETDEKPPYLVNGDRVQLKQVIQNLIDNSMKYTKEGWIKVKVSKNIATNKIMVAISDSGMGIKPEILPQLFKEFSRGNGANVDVGGSGIGLYLAKEIIEKGHQGRVWAESDGKGSTFFLELPIHSA